MVTISGHVSSSKTVSLDKWRSFEFLLHTFSFITVVLYQFSIYKLLLSILSLAKANGEEKKLGLLFSLSCRLIFHYRDGGEI